MEKEIRKTTQAMTRETADNWMLLKIHCKAKNVNETMKIAQELLKEKLGKEINL